MEYSMPNTSRHQNVFKAASIVTSAKRNNFLQLSILLSEKSMPVQRQQGKANQSYEFRQKHPNFKKLFFDFRNWIPSI